jgi:hypothetical protein
MAAAYLILAIESVTLQYRHYFTVPRHGRRSRNGPALHVFVSDGDDEATPQLASQSFPRAANDRIVSVSIALLTTEI